jgi:hypothetical protein
MTGVRFGTARQRKILYTDGMAALPRTHAQKHKARIDKLTHALHGMRPARRRDDKVRAKRIDAELTLLRNSDTSAP